MTYGTHRLYVGSITSPVDDKCNSHACSPLPSTISQRIQKRLAKYAKMCTTSLSQSISTSCTSPSSTSSPVGLPHPKLHSTMSLLTLRPTTAALCLQDTLHLNPPTMTHIVHSSEHEALQWQSQNPDVLSHSSFRCQLPHHWSENLHQRPTFPLPSLSCRKRYATAIATEIQTRSTKRTSRTSPMVHVRHFHAPNQD